MSKTVVVFCGRFAKKQYLDQAYEVGKTLAEHGYVIACGGEKGMMDEVCRGAIEQKGKTIGIYQKQHGEISRFLTERIEYNDIVESQKKLISLGSAYIALPGGYGTLYEIMETLKDKYFNLIPEENPFICIGDYYRELEQLLYHMAEEGFITFNLKTYIQFVEAPEDAIRLLKKYEISH